MVQGRNRALCRNKLLTAYHRDPIKITSHDPDLSLAGKTTFRIKVHPDFPKIIIKIDKSKDFGPSKSGKTIIVASTGGNHKVDGTEVVLGLNCYKKR